MTRRHAHPVDRWLELPPGLLVDQLSMARLPTGVPEAAGRRLWRAFWTALGDESGRQVLCDALQEAAPSVALRWFQLGLRAYTDPAAQATLREAGYTRPPARLRPVLDADLLRWSLDPEIHDRGYGRPPVLLAMLRGSRDARGRHRVSLDLARRLLEAPSAGRTSLALDYLATLPVGTAGCAALLEQCFDAPEANTWTRAAALRALYPGPISEERWRQIAGQYVVLARRLTRLKRNPMGSNADRRLVGVARLLLGRPTSMPARRQTAARGALLESLLHVSRSGSTWDRRRRRALGQGMGRALQGTLGLASGALSDTRVTKSLVPLWINWTMPGNPERCVRLGAWGLLLTLLQPRLSSAERAPMTRALRRALDRLAPDFVFDVGLGPVESVALPTRAASYPEVTPLLVQALRHTHGELIDLFACICDAPTMSALVAASADLDGAERGDRYRQAMRRLRRRADFRPDGESLIPFFTHPNPVVRDAALQLMGRPA